MMALPWPTTIVGGTGQPLTNPFVSHTKQCSANSAHAAYHAMPSMPCNSVYSAKEKRERKKEESNRPAVKASTCNLLKPPPPPKGSRTNMWRFGFRADTWLDSGIMHHIRGARLARAPCLLKTTLQTTTPTAVSLHMSWQLCAAAMAAAGPAAGPLMWA